MLVTSSVTSLSTSVVGAAGVSAWRRGVDAVVEVADVAADEGVEE